MLRVHIHTRRKYVYVRAAGSKGRARWLHYFHYDVLQVRGRSSDDAKRLGATQNAMHFHRVGEDRFVTLSRCNYTSSGECKPGSTSERAESGRRGRTHTRRWTRQCVSLIIPAIIINCSDPRHADEIASQERAVKYGNSTEPED